MFRSLFVQGFHATGAATPGQLSRLHLLRGLAALAVVYHHLSTVAKDMLGAQSWLPASGLTWAGVDLFFVLSGFLMVWTTRGKSGGLVPARDFLVARMSRIYPMYWMALLMTALAMVLLPVALPQAPQCSLLCQVSLLPERNEFLIGPAWTLSFEILFYLVFASLMFLGEIWRLRLLALWTLVVALGGALLSMATGVVPLHHLLTPLILEFLAGAWVAVALNQGLRLTGKAPLAALILALGVGAVGFNTVVGTLPGGLAEWARFVLCGLMSAGVVWCLASSDVEWPQVLPRVAHWLGDRSYAIYLVHWPANVVVASFVTTLPVPMPVRLALYVGASLVLTLGLAEALTRWVGAPVQTWAKAHLTVKPLCRQA